MAAGRYRSPVPEFEKRKIFISWSKQPTDQVASALKSLLLHMFDNIAPFVSKETIEYGTLSIPEIFKALSGSDFGFLIVTTKNQTEPWLNFEAGALAKSIADDGDTRVVPLLIDFDNVGQLSPGPIANLQAQVVREYELLNVVRMMARFLEVDAATVDARWPAAWASFSDVLEEVREQLAQAEGDSAPDRTAEDMLEELLALTRGQVRRQGSLGGVDLSKESGRVDADPERWEMAAGLVKRVAEVAATAEISKFVGGRVVVTLSDQVSDQQISHVTAIIEEFFAETGIHSTVDLPGRDYQIRTFHDGRARRSVRRAARKSGRQDDSET